MFSTEEKRIWYSEQMRLALETNVFSAGDECIQCWRRTRLALETNPFSARDKPVQHQKQTYLKCMSFIPCICSILYTVVNWLHTIILSSLLKLSHKNSTTTSITCFILISAIPTYIHVHVHIAHLNQSNSKSGHYQKGHCMVILLHQGCSRF